VTFLEVSYHFAGPLTPEQARQAGDLPAHYGIRGIHFDEETGIARVEFDASRLKEGEVVHWIRRAGIPLLERVAVDGPAA